MLRRLLYALASFALFLGLWELLAMYLGPRVLPGPLAVCLDFLHRAVDPKFLTHFAVSFWRASAGILLGLVIPYPIGLVLGASRRLDRFFSPLVFLTYPVPKVLLLPVLLVLLGLGEAPKVILVALTVGYQVLVVTRDSVINLDRRYLNSFFCVYPSGPTRERPLRRALSLARHVLVPYSLPSVITSLRLASGTAVAVLFMAESFATQRGLGFVIMDAWGLMDLPRMFSGILAMGILGGFYFELSNLAEKTLCRWKLAEKPGKED
jgi:NitT/TauT family transport system permease protein